jgi:PAS domain-containing protein
MARTAPPTPPEPSNPRRPAEQAIAERMLVIDYGTDGTIAAVNPLALSLLGYRLTELSGIDVLLQSQRRLKRTSPVAYITCAPLVI